MPNVGVYAIKRLLMPTTPSTTGRRIVQNIFRGAWGGFADAIRGVPSCIGMCVYPRREVEGTTRSTRMYACGERRDGRPPYPTRGK